MPNHVFDSHNNSFSVVKSIKMLIGTKFAAISLFFRYSFSAGKLQVKKKHLKEKKLTIFVFFSDMKLIITKRVHINRIKIADNAYFFCTLMEMNGYIHKSECTWSVPAVYVL